MKKNIYAGLFLVTLGILMYELLLTRIFSVTMFYHFAFFAVSVAIFGMTVGAILVYLFPNYFTQEKARKHLALSSLLFAISIPLSFLTHLSIPFVIQKSIVGFYSIALNYVIISIPFIFSGICVCLALTKFPRHVSKLYAADLMGAAFGCVVLILTLKITDGPTAVIGAAFLVSIGAVFFACDKSFRRLLKIALVVSFLLALFIIVNTNLVNKQNSLLRLVWVKGEIEEKPLYEKWNSFSRIKVFGNPDAWEIPLGWGFSENFPADQKVKQLQLNIDANAGTFLTAFDGNLDNLEYLKYDVTNIVHYIRSDADVFVIGSGGGRDILSALLFNQKSVVGVEINEDIIKAVNEVYGDFTGHLDKHPKVRFVNDEARSYITRQTSKFDIIQSSLTDSWAATGAGAFILAENSLYTVEAWEVFLEHLTPNGVLTFVRWYNPEAPDEAYRLVSLARTSLMELGIENPRDHIIVVVRKPWVATILVGRAPFSGEDLDTIERVASEKRFDIVLSPRFSSDSIFEKLTSTEDLSAFFKEFPVNLEAPTDNKPFFFNMVRFRNMFDRELWERGGERKNARAYFILGTLLLTVLVLSLVCIILPLILRMKKGVMKGNWYLLMFFIAIGFAFMFIEISQMQRLIIFLGHPIYGISVVLFTLLLASGLGSYLTRKIGKVFSLKRMGTICLAFLLLVLFIFGLLTPLAISAFRGFTTVPRILIAIGILFPLGMFMGMAFPLGMKAASIKASSLTSWLWGVNGAASICASVIAIVICLGFSISATFWVGALFYIIAFLAFIQTNRTLLIIN